MTLSSHSSQDFSPIGRERLSMSTLTLLSKARFRNLWQILVYRLESNTSLVVVLIETLLHNEQVCLMAFLYFPHCSKSRQLPHYFSIFFKSHTKLIEILCSDKSSLWIQTLLWSYQNLILSKESYEKLALILCLIFITCKTHKRRGKRVHMVKSSVLCPKMLETLYNPKNHISSYKVCLIECLCCFISLIKR